jgi:hypothetical protein
MFTWTRRRAARLDRHAADASTKPHQGNVAIIDERITRSQ